MMRLCGRTNGVTLGAADAGALPLTRISRHADRISLAGGGQSHSCTRHRLAENEGNVAVHAHCAHQLVSAHTTAKTLGLTIPEPLLLRANELIE